MATGINGIEIKPFDGVRFCNCNWIVSWIKSGMALIADGNRSVVVHVSNLEKVIDREFLRKEFNDPYPEE